MMTETSDKIKTDDKIITDDKIKTNDQNNDIKNLELQLRQRDNEISILVRMLSKRSKNSTKPSDENNNHETAVKVETAVTAETVIEENKKRSEDKLICEKKQSNEKKIISQIQTDDKPIKRQESSFDELELLRDRAKAFEVFRKNFRSNEAFDNNKELLRGQFAEAKNLGQRANDSRAAINKLKGKIEKLRLERVMTDCAMNENDPAEMEMRKEIDELKLTYKSCTDRLRIVKGDIEGIQKTLERNKETLKRDFQVWFEAMERTHENNPVNRINLVDQNDSVNYKTNDIPKSGPPPNGAHESGVPRYTGDETIDRDVAAFYRARDSLRK
eukprot:GHVL01014274.1.p2 GENE.GHVL01014274.1~~GHVL01014274.1.p2  ORF type:complete len:329 (-),score=111.97 GHVL01014274.1:50-1036(-)